MHVGVAFSMSMHPRIAISDQSYSYKQVLLFSPSIFYFLCPLIFAILIVFGLP